jgi:hypothetical protein
MRNVRLSVAVAALVGLSFTPVFAGQHGNSGNHGPSTPPVHPDKPPNAGPKSTGATNDNGSKSHGPNASTTTPTNGPINFASTPLGVKLTNNTALQSKLTTNLTALGYKGTVFQAAYGFKNLGQFVAATNVSKNLGIPFDQLKVQMTGLSVDPNGNVTKANLNADGTISMVDPTKVTSPAPTKSLGQSIQALKPAADAKTAANTADKEAETEIEQTSKDSKKKS